MRYLLFGYFSFGDEGSFRDLIAAQFGDSFDLKRLPEN